MASIEVQQRYGFMQKISGHIVLPDSVLAGTVSFDAIVTEIAADHRAPDRWILPGFIDTHVHGGGGGDVIDGPGGIETLARFHLRHGTTTILPTTITRPWPEVMAMLHAVAAVRRQGLRDGPDIPGAHLEGPFISPLRLGAQPPFAILPEPHRVEAVLATGAVSIVTLAPELAHAEAAIRAFARAGTRVSLGHTMSDFEQATAAIARIEAHGGVAGGTHLFNAMDGIAGRLPGVVGALLRGPNSFAELILDTHHVHPASFQVARDALGDRLLLITDAIRATGLGDGVSELGGQPVTIRGGVARLQDGSLAGSVLTLDMALRHALAAGTALPHAARLLSTNPARYLGLPDRGRLQPGLRADFVVIEPDCQVTEVWVAGRRVV